VCSCKDEEHATSKSPSVFETAWAIVGARRRKGISGTQFLWMETVEILPGCETEQKRESTFY
jgi:hypothetical protein